MTKAQEKTVDVLLARHGTTYASEANIRLRDTPAPLYQLLVFAVLLSAWINARILVAAARELFAAGFRTPVKMAGATWQQRVDALGRGHYRRYDERTSTMLGDGADLLKQRYGGDLRRLRDQSESRDQLLEKLQEFPGIGPTNASIFCREVQGIWPQAAPYVEAKVVQGAQALELPTEVRALARLVRAEDLPRLAAACVRAALDKGIVEEGR